MSSNVYTLTKICKLSKHSVQLEKICHCNRYTVVSAFLIVPGASVPGIHCIWLQYDVLDILGVLDVSDILKALDIDLCDSDTAHHSHPIRRSVFRILETSSQVLQPT